MKFLLMCVIFITFQSSHCYLAIDSEENNSLQHRPNKNRYNRKISIVSNEL